MRSQEELYALAVRVLEGEERARRWLNAPNHLLEGGTPLEHAGTELRTEFVRQLLAQIEHGVFS